MEAERWVAFSTDPAGGNPAGVVLAASRPTDEQMQRTAAEVGFSETAFLVPVAPGRFWTRYFAPLTEVPFCGHATIASAVSLGTADPSLAAVTFETVAGDVEVTIDRVADDVLATLTSPPARSWPVPDAQLDALLTLFGWGPGELDDRLAPGVGHAGANHPVLALAERATLAAMDYPFDELQALMTEHDWTTIQLVHREDERTFQARDPFPVGGVVEDPATGAAAAALGGLLRDRGVLPPDGRFTVHQGVDLGRPSVLEVDASGTGGVRVTGAAVPMT